MSEPVVIIGAGHSGVQAAASLREEGYEGPIVLVSDETHLPYQRPPLSKAFMKRQVTAEGLVLRSADFYAQKAIDLRLGESVTRIDRANRKVKLHVGGALAYAHLVLATGARARPLGLPGADLPGIMMLRNLTHAGSLREAFEAARDIVVIGAGFIGLEFAAVAAPLGAKVHVLEMAPRPMARALSEAMSMFFAAAHQASGVELLFGCGVKGFHGAGHVESVELADGRRIPADLVLAGIGVLPEDRLAQACGLNCVNGIVVDATMLTSDPHISAIGDCTSHPNVFAGDTIRLESVQNATDQARVVAKRLTGKPATYATVPWFWSDQGDLKLQIVGFLSACDAFVVRGDPQARAFSVFGFREGRLTGVESVNKAGDHMAARRIIGQGLPLTPEQAKDAAFDLKAFAMARG